MTAVEARRYDLRLRGRGVVGWIGGALLGLVLLVAAAAKALDPAGFGREIVALGLPGGIPPLAAAVAAIGFEALLGLLLLLDVRRPAVIVAAALLVAFFLAVTGRSAWRAAHGIVDDSPSCGCFGNLVERTPQEAFVQDLWMLLPPLALALLGLPGARRRLGARVIAAGIGAAALGGFAAAAPGLPLDDLATRLAPGTLLSGRCAGSGTERVCLDVVAPRLASGRHLVVLADLAAPDFEELAPRLNAWARADSQPPLTVLGELSEERRTELFWSVAPAFDLHDTPPALLRPLYRTLPRSFLVEDGRVRETWTGLPPQIAALAP